MKTSSSSLFALAVTSLAFGCAAPGADEAPGQSDNNEVQVQSQKLTAADCATQRDTCFSKNPLFGFFTCPAQYTQCVATASSGLPAQVSSAISSAAACTKQEVQCQTAARSAADTLACTEAAAKCVATIVDADLPEVVDGTAECVSSSVDCINSATKVSDLAGCAKSLTSCAVEQVQQVIPPEVGKVVSAANDCRVTLNACIAAASDGAAITQCSEDAATCAAATLNVTLPQVPLADVVDCGESATNCALNASSISDVTECATALQSCAAKVVGEVPVPPQLTCEQKWTACVAANPFNIFKCAADASTCKD